MISKISAALFALAFMAAPVLPASAANVANGKQLAEQHCAKCHGRMGEGNGPAISLMNMKAPIDWTNKAKMSKLSDAQLTKIIDEGGAAVGKSKHMPAYSKRLTKAQVADVVAYIRSLAK